MAEGFFASSMLARGQKNGLIDIRTHQLRDWTSDKHNKTDELPYGGGAGMVMKPETIFAAVEQLRKPQSKVVYMAPDGLALTSQLARELAQEEHLIILSGHYEGVDQRVRDDNLISKIGGIILLITGVLILTNQLQSIGFYIIEIFPFMQKFG